MNKDPEINIMKTKPLKGKKYDKSLTFGEKRAEMLRLELLYQKIMRNMGCKYEKN